jgi:hypothetical protein
MSPSNIARTLVCLCALLVAGIVEWRPFQRVIRWLQGRDRRTLLPNQALPITD